MKWKFGIFCNCKKYKKEWVHFQKVKNVFGFFKKKKYKSARWICKKKKNERIFALNLQKSTDFPKLFYVFSGIGERCKNSRNAKNTIWILLENWKNSGNYLVFDGNNMFCLQTNKIAYTYIGKKWQKKIAKRNLFTTESRNLKMDMLIWREKLWKNQSKYFDCEFSDKHLIDCRRTGHHKNQEKKETSRD